MRIESKHPSYDRRTVGRAVRWAAKQIGLETAVLKTLKIEVGFRRSRYGTDWGGWYHHTGRRVLVLLPRSPDKEYPEGVGWNGAEEDRQALDELELFVSILAHELEHARCYAAARTYRQQRTLNREDRVRAVDWRAVLEFRKDRDRILESWRKPCPTT
jgi:hypothetical protein